MATDSFKVKKSLHIDGNTSATTEAGDIRFDSSDSKFKAHDGTSEEALVKASELAATDTEVATKADQSALDTHTGDTTNPHSVTKTQVGLGNVTDDAQLKIASNLADLANAATARTNIGLGNVDNTSDATKNSAVATLENKTLTSPVINIQYLTEQASTPATPASGTKLLYVKSSDGKIYSLDSAGNEVEIGAGGGSGGINHIDSDSANIETSVGSWVTYADAAAATPVDGTGGTASVISLSRITSGQLRGDGSLRITKSAANGQGEGVSVDFTAHNHDGNIGKLWGSFDFKASSGYVTNDLQAFIVDTVTGDVITPKRRGTNSRQAISFPITNGSTAFRLVFHCTSTNTASWTFDVDNVRIGPEPIWDMPIITEWQSYTPTVTFLGSGSIASTVTYYRRVGDTLEVKGLFTKDATAGTGASAIGLSLPSGLTVDDTSITANFNQNIGSASLLDASSRYEGTVQGNSTTTVGFLIDKNHSSGTHVLQGQHVGASAIVAYSFSVPIAEWASSSALMSTTEALNATAQVEASATAIAAATGSNSITSYSSSEQSLTILDTSTGVITIPETQFYTFSLYGATDSVAWTAVGQTASLSIDINSGARTIAIAAQRAMATGTYRMSPSGAKTVKLNKDDVVIVKEQTDVSAGWANVELSVVGHHTNSHVGVYGELNKWQTKHLSADVTADGAVSDFTFSSLEIDKVYRVSGAIYFNCSGDDNVFLTGSHDSSTVGIIGADGGHSGTAASTVHPNIIFKATATSLTFAASSITSPSTIRGNGTRSLSFLQLEEVNSMHPTENTSW